MKQEEDESKQRIAAELSAFMQHQVKGEPSIPVSTIRELVEEWREQMGHLEGDSIHNQQVVLAGCADQLEALLK